MKIFCFALCCFVVVLHGAAVEQQEKHHHHKHHKHHHHHHHHNGHHHGRHHKVATHTIAGDAKVTSAAGNIVATAQVSAKKMDAEQRLVAKMKELEKRLEQKRAAARKLESGHLLVNGPVPVDFSERFAQAVAQATGVDPRKVAVTKVAAVANQPGVASVDFQAPAKIVSAVEEQSADENSKLANGSLHSFLVADDDDDESETKKPAPRTRQAPASRARATPVESKSMDIDTAMPYGELEPFGREDTAQELTEDSISESNQMVDQLERAEVAEEKRSVFRALTRLRGAAITSFDGIARAQTGQIDEYNKIHQWRRTHPLHHLADEESDVSKWAFPDNADF